MLGYVVLSMPWPWGTPPLGPRIHRHAHALSWPSEAHSSRFRPIMAPLRPCPAPDVHPVALRPRHRRAGPGVPILGVPLPWGVRLARALHILKRGGGVPLPVSTHPCSKKNFGFTERGPSVSDSFLPRNVKTKISRQIPPPPSFDVQLRRLRFFGKIFDGIVLISPGRAFLSGKAEIVS